MIVRPLRFTIAALAISAALSAFAAPDQKPAAMTPATVARPLAVTSGTGGAYWDF